jgi:hypothetical protein
VEYDIEGERISEPAVDIIRRAFLGDEQNPNPGYNQINSQLPPPPPHALMLDPVKTYLTFRNPVSYGGIS